MKSIFPDKFLKLVLITSIWVNISEVFRYFIIVVPSLKKHLALLTDFAPVNLTVISVWGIWDTILTAGIVFVTWLCFKVYGKSTKTILISGTTTWALFFLLYWVGMANMNLTKVYLLAFTLPLCWIETTIGAWITIKLLRE